MIGRMLWVGFTPIALAIFNEKVAKAEAQLPTAKQRPPPPQVIKIPAGWRYAQDTEITSEMSQFAVATLGKGLLPGDVEQATTSTGSKYAALTDWHFDDHRSPGVQQWHIGVSILLPTSKPWAN